MISSPRRAICLGYMKLEEGHDGLRSFSLLSYMIDWNYSHINQLQGSREQHDLPAWISTATYQENTLLFEPFILGGEKSSSTYVQKRNWFMSELSCPTELQNSSLKKTDSALLWVSWSQSPSPSQLSIKSRAKRVSWESAVCPVLFSSNMKVCQNSMLIRNLAITEVAHLEPKIEGTHKTKWPITIPTGFLIWLILQSFETMIKPRKCLCLRSKLYSPTKRR